MSYTFRQRRNPDNQYSITDIRFKVDAEATLTALLDEFKLFLSACGFYVPAGSTLCLVEPDEDHGPVREQLVDNWDDAYHTPGGAKL